VVVVNSGTRVLLDKYPQQTDAWYGGAVTSYWSHEPTTGTLLSFNAVPDSGVTWSEGDGFSCTDIAHDGLNTDLWSSNDNLCSEANKSYSPLFYKSLRGLQVWIEGACTSFVDPTRSWDGGTAKPRTMTIAEFFAACSINSGTSTVGAEDGGHWYASIGTLEGVSLYWTILNDDFSVRREGTAPSPMARLTWERDYQAMKIKPSSTPRDGRGTLRGVSTMPIPRRFSFRATMMGW
jgi:hypothetical protein